MAKRDEAVYDILDSTRNISKALEISTTAIAFLAVFRASFPASKYASKLPLSNPANGAKFYRFAVKS